MKETYKSRVYTDRPDYADFAPAAKFTAIESIIAKRLTEHPKAICSYSGGADSDILIDLIERTRRNFGLPPIKYVFFNTGLEMKATKDHVKAVAEKYGVEIEECRPKVNIVTASRKYGIPFVSKIMSAGLEQWQKKGVPLSIAEEYNAAEDKAAKRRELKERYPNCESLINFLCCCNSAGEPRPNIQLVINSSKYMRDFIGECPPDFPISAKCCDCCKKQLAHSVQKDYDMIITGERRDEGGMRSVPRKDNTSLCFTETGSGQYRLRPLYYVSDKDKAWYKEHYGIRYSDAYEVYGLTRTGCCGCPISYKAVEDLEMIRPYEPNVVKAAWNIFGKSYEYRQKYNEYADKLGTTQKVVYNYMRRHGISARVAAKRNQCEEANSTWKGGKTVDEFGYVMIRSPDHPRASKCGQYVPEHILVAEKTLGRYLNQDEVVHHINGVTGDNRPENLLVLTKSEHTKLHWLIRKFHNQAINSHESIPDALCDHIVEICTKEG